MDASQEHLSPANLGKALSNAQTFNDLKREQIALLSYEFFSLFPIFNLTAPMIEDKVSFTKEIEGLRYIGAVCEFEFRRVVQGNNESIKEDCRDLLLESMNRFCNGVFEKLRQEDVFHSPTAKTLRETACQLRELLKVALGTEKLTDFIGAPNTFGLNHTVEELHKAFTSSNVFSSTINMSSEFFVNCDSNQMFCALMNIFNAVSTGCISHRDAIDQEIPLEIKSAVVVRDSKKFVELQIKDSGPGIPNAELSTLFDVGVPFSGRSGVYNRSCGLQYAQAVIEGAGGTLTVDSKSVNDHPGCADSFTVFKLLLPLVELEIQPWKEVTYPMRSRFGLPSRLLGAVKHFVLDE